MTTARPAPVTALDYLEGAWTTNPFDSDDARANSSYAGFDGNGLVRLLETVEPSPFERIAHDAFRNFVTDDVFSCLGARAAIHRKSYRFGAYRRLDDPAVTAGLARDLYAFANERRGFESTFTTFVTVFAGFDTTADPQAGFERALWSQLERLHALDREHHAWDASVSSNPADAHYSYSFAGTGFFVVGLHPDSPRTARRFAWPALIFNAHEQFERLKEAGTFDGLQRSIRDREMRLDGSINANLAEFGEKSEARQYSGRPVSDDWRCPFGRS